MTSPAPLFRSLASMHRAGIPWPRALESAARGDPAWASTQRALERGGTVAEAFDGAVDPLDHALLAAGEQDGTLERTFESLAELHENAKRQGREQVTSLLYPLVVAHLAALLMPIPDLVAGNPGGALFWALIVLVPTWLFLGLRLRLARAARPRPELGTEPPQPLPMIGPLRNIVEEADARALDAFGRLHDAGVDLDQALALAARAGWGGRVAVDLTEARRRVAAGGDLAGAFQRLPEELVGRLRSAEEAGAFGEACRRVADGFRFDVDTRRRRAAALTPVFVMLVVGGLVAWRLFSFYSGLYSGLGR